MDEPLIPGRPTEMCSNPGSSWCGVTSNRPISQLAECVFLSRCHGQWGRQCQTPELVESLLWFLWS